MSLVAEDRQTTYAYTYRPPDVTPGYTGYVPQQRFSYGDTFGNATATHFQARRNMMFLSSISKTDKEYLPPLVKFPTVYSNDPTLVLANRKRSRERWMAAHKYTVNEEATKEAQLQTFLKNCQQHREHYKDSTGTVRLVDEFLLPKLTACEISAPSTVSTIDQVNKQIPVVADNGRRSKYTRMSTRFTGNCRQRAIRDQIFENR